MGKKKLKRWIAKGTNKSGTMEVVSVLGKDRTEARQKVNKSYRLVKVNSLEQVD